MSAILDPPYWIAKFFKYLRATSKLISKFRKNIRKKTRNVKNLK